jgi:polysaccharide deacetylase 2 family uncharacterized protein YibQ
VSGRLLPWLLVLAILIAVGIGMMAGHGDKTALHGGALPSRVIPLPRVAPASEDQPPSAPSKPAAPPTSGPPVAVDPALVEQMALGPLPRIAPDGRRPLDYYARRPAAACASPCIAVLVVGLGLARGLTSQALALPAEVGLSFSTYAADLGGWQKQARRAGHEVLLDLPLQPERYPEDDSGPLTIQAAWPAARQDAAVLRVLAQGSGYLAVSAPAGAFAAVPGSFAAVARTLQARGLGFVELGGGRLARAAAKAGLVHAGAMGPIDAEAAPEAIDRALAGLEAAARREGRVFAFAQPMPVTFRHLGTWIATLPEKGLVPVPPSALLDPPARSR